MSSEKTILIFCPDISGHRHLYCRHLIDFFLSRSCKVFLAHSGKISAYRSFARFGYQAGPFPHHLDDRLYSGMDITAELNAASNALQVCASVAERVQATDVVHVDADLYRLHFSWKRTSHCLRGVQNHLVILNTEYEDVAAYDVTLSQEWKNILKMVRIQRRSPASVFARVTFVERAPRWTKRITRALSNNPVVTSVLVCDPRVRDDFMGKDLQVPEIGISVWSHEESSSPLSDVEAQFYQAVRAKLEQSTNLQLILAFGDLEERKGFRELLRLCAERKNTLCVRVGRTKPFYTRTWQEVLDKETLIQEERLLELDCYVSPRFIRKMIEQTKMILLPYKRFYRTSASFMDIGFLQKPVIAPERGLIGSLIREFQTGETYNPDDDDALVAAYDRLSEGLEDLHPALEGFHEHLRRESVYRQFDGMLA